MVNLIAPSDYRTFVLSHLQTIDTQLGKDRVIVKLTGQRADTPTHGLVSSQTGQIVDAAANISGGTLKMMKLLLCIFSFCSSALCS